MLMPKWTLTLKGTTMAWRLILHSAWRRSSRKGAVWTPWAICKRWVRSACSLNGYY